ncbi:MAG: class A beta-lactamase-related serine hydrolase [Propionibacteriaceae bacterium]|nr:class A beta-lactamase-related serine hydrolase [Propionibacteriaceae bacterium]
MVVVAVGVGVVWSALRGSGDRGPTGAGAGSAEATPSAATATPTPTPTPTPGPTLAATPSPADPGLAEALAAVVAAAEAATGADLGVAALAAGGDRPAVAGGWTTGHAWSTVKVPLAIAALDAGVDGAGAFAQAAITMSDNDAAWSLWNGLGAGDAAGSAVEAVLAAGGDTATTVQRTQARPEYTPFGQTTWTLEDQARFAAHWPAGAAAAQVWALMGQVDPSQRWGLGRFDGARFKGGWGPDDGGHTVRQFGVVAVPGGCTALAVGASAATFEAGVSALDDLAARLMAMADGLPAGECPVR